MSSRHSSSERWLVAGTRTPRAPGSGSVGILYDTAGRLDIEIVFHLIVHLGRNTVVLTVGGCIQRLARVDLDDIDIQNFISLSLNLRLFMKSEARLLKASL